MSQSSALNPKKLLTSEPSPKKTKKRRSRQFWLHFSNWTAVSSIVLTCLIVSCFGLALSSLNFSQRLKSVVRDHVSGTYLIIDPKSLKSAEAPGVEAITMELLEKAYLIDALSTLTYQQLLDQNIYNQYVNFAYSQFYRD